VPFGIAQNQRLTGTPDRETHASFYVDVRFSMELVSSSCRIGREIMRLDFDHGHGSEVPLSYLYERGLDSIPGITW
jgi:hypothetical protein